MSQRDLRQRVIRRLLQTERLSSQAALRQRLREEGLQAEQATLSRDLHALGVVKGPDGYVLPDALAMPNGQLPQRRAELVIAVRQFLGPVAASEGASVEHAGNLVVLRTGPGRAQPLALSLDRACLDAVAGTIAGDDTIFLAVRSEDSARALVALFRAVAAGTDDEAAARLVGDDGAGTEGVTS